jgi:hypothetical protein
MIGARDSTTTKQESLAVGCKLLGVYFVVSHFGTLTLGALQAFTTLRATNTGNVPTEFCSMSVFGLVQTLGVIVMGCLLTWQTDWCVGLIVANDRHNHAD